MNTSDITLKRSPELSMQTPNDLRPRAYNGEAANSKRVPEQFHWLNY